MSSPKQILKGIGPKLVPFFKTVTIYFAFFIPVNEPSLFAAVLKCLPICSLIAFVLLHGMSLGDEYAYSRRVLFGLILSVVGDAFLVWNETFFHGLAAFLIAQLFYISAFGFKPFNLSVCATVYGIMAAGLYILVGRLNGFLTAAIIMYAVVLMTMVWRAVARVQLFDDLWTWTKLCSCAGGILFAISDTCIGFNEFYAKIPHAQSVIMITYYAAQLGVSLSVVDSKASTTSPSKTQSGTRTWFVEPSYREKESKGIRSVTEVRSSDN